MHVSLQPYKVILNESKDNSLRYWLNPIFAYYLILICLLFKWSKMLQAGRFRFMSSLIYETSHGVRSVFIGARIRLQRRLIYGLLATKVQKVDCYSKRSFSFGLFLSRFSRYRSVLIMDKFREESLSSLICARTITRN